ncbi:MAG: tetratricopeptide repeat family protein [Glaciihabitans sp.]|nr:tetratricopeptide repeat family protein [Glaciihabitans sp.]
MWSPEEYDNHVLEARSGDVQAMFQVAVFHNRRGDMDEAHEWFEKAANAGAIEARAYLGWVYKMKDLPDEAIRWTRQAAMDGNDNAKVMLDMLLNPSDDSRPEIVAMAHMSKLMGDAAASLGNWAQARDGWYRAADMGNLEAMTLMGRLEEQEGAAGAAILWHERAALRGSNESMLRLGGIHHRRGDASLAREWFTVAAESGNTEAEKILWALPD